MQISLKTRLQFLATSASATTDAMVLKSFPDTIQQLKSWHCEIFKNQITINRIMCNYLSSCNAHQFKIIANDHFWFLATLMGKILMLRMAMKFFQMLSFYCTSMVLNKIDKMVNNHSNSSNFKKSVLILVKMICNI